MRKILAVLISLCMLAMSFAIAGSVSGLDPLDSSDAYEDSDGDGLTNVQEFEAGADPNDPDTDGDTLPDGWTAGRPNTRTSAGLRRRRAPG